MTLDEVYDRLKFIGEDSDVSRGEIANAILRLPGDVAEWAIDQLVFLTPPDASGVAYTFAWNPPIDAEEFHILRIVYVACRVFSEQPEDVSRVVAHEIAHHRLGHVGLAAEGAEYDRREADAESLLKEWGF